MSCSPFDLRDYFLQELADKDRRQVEAHVRGCQSCREELERLDMTQAALLSLREEEIPQRIAFVSDAVFEPSRWRRAWTALWNSGPRLGFVSAAMLSAALVVFALNRPAAPVATPAPVRTVAAVAPQLTEAQIQERIDAAVARAVAASERKQAESTKLLQAELDTSREKWNLLADQFDVNLKRQMATNSQLYTASAEGERR